MTAQWTRALSLGFLANQACVGGQVRTVAYYLYPLHKQQAASQEQGARGSGPIGGEPVRSAGDTTHAVRPLLAVHDTRSLDCAEPQPRLRPSRNERVGSGQSFAPSRLFSCGDVNRRGTTMARRHAWLKFR
jgi:hypothetical protein